MKESDKAYTILDCLVESPIRQDIVDKIDTKMQEISRQIVEAKAEHRTAECIRLVGTFDGLHLALKLAGIEIDDLLAKDEK